MITAPLYPPPHMMPASVDRQANGQPKIKFVNPNSGNFDRNIRNAGKLARQYKMIQHNELAGKRAVIIGSGPSLNDPAVMDEIKQLADDGWLMVPLKKAIRVLYDQSIRIDMSVTMDPGAHIANPTRLYKAPGMTTIVASSSDVLLFDYLATDLPYEQWIKEQSAENREKILSLLFKQSGAQDFDAWFKEYIANYQAMPEALPANIRIFHSACGLPNEVQMYKSLFADKSGIEADAWCAGGGYNVTNRAVSAFMFMGIEQMVIAGADGGWREGQSFYADGTQNRPGVDMCDEGRVDGTPWHTRPDMLASSVALTRLAKKMNKDKSIQRMRFLGDVMPQALMSKDEQFLTSCVSFQK